MLYKELLEMPETDPVYHTYSAACLFYMALYDEAREAALRGKIWSYDMSCPTFRNLRFVSHVKSLLSTCKHFIWLHLHFRLRLFVICFVNFRSFGTACVFDTSAQCKLGCIVGPENPLQIRILFHIAHRQNDEKVLLEYHMKLGESHEDQLSLASIHYLRTHYQEAIDIYKRILLKTR